MIELTPELLFAVGGHRSCYRHPGDPQKCIKVLHEPWQEIGRRIRDPLRHVRRRVNYDENLSELKSIHKMEHKLGKQLQDHFPKAYGMVPTNLGEGLVCDFICNADGSPAPTLKSLLWQEGLSDEVQAALDRFWDFLLQHRVIVRNPHPHNIVIRTTEAGAIEAYLIDGFGRADFLPFVEWFPSLTIRKLKARRARQKRQIQKHLKDIQAGISLKGKGVLLEAGPE
ncbi:YrbL family protein [Coraliomargarita parva]|uniref:YrbL family protein n=1 Tax=Coraliomargarita parva TaxID=3014050 RepID=UPI0022B3B172|nr:YrbL family protein [Coraliomargarita parva]